MGNQSWDFWGLFLFSFLGLQRRMPLGAVGIGSSFTVGCIGFDRFQSSQIFVPIFMGCFFLFLFLLVFLFFF